jgi:hypothetical protein
MNTTKSENDPMRTMALKQLMSNHSAASRSNSFRPFHFFSRSTALTKGFLLAPDNTIRRQTRHPLQQVCRAEPSKSTVAHHSRKSSLCSSSSGAIFVRYSNLKSRSWKPLLKQRKNPGYLGKYVAKFPLFSGIIL